jgi:dihydroxyacetone kinase-like protein
MAESIDYNILVRMLHAAVQQVRDNHQTLSRLDSFGGDGDHGTTMLRAMELLSKTIDSSPKQLPQLLHDIGWAIMGVDGGATGPLLGTLFMGMADAVAGRKELDAYAAAAMFEAGLAALQKQTKAQVGDKTMMDALVPAVAALRSAAAAGESVAAALQRAAEAAEAGAASTKNLRARFGRAKNLGDRSIGSQDPGATSTSLLFRGFADALAPGKGT